MESKLRIAVVANANSIHTIRWVDWLRQRNHKVIIFSLNEGDDCVYFGPEPALDRSLIFNLGKNVRKTTSELQTKIDEFKPDIVHGFFLTNHGMYSSRIKNYPKVITALGSDALISPNDSKLMSWIVKRAVKNSDLVISVAEHLNDVVSPWKRDGVKSITSPLGIDVQKFKPLDKENIIVFNRGFKEVYSPFTLLEAIASISDKIKDYELIMCGEGPLLEKCKKYVADESLSELVSFPGYVPNAELVNLLGRSKYWFHLH
jgi:L-malate glycosyltransferase